MGAWSSFLSDLFAETVAKMAGGAGVLATIIGFYVTPVVARWIFFGLALMSVLVLQSLAWRREYGRAESLERAVGEASFLGSQPVSLIVSSGGPSFRERAVTLATNSSPEGLSTPRRLRFAWLFGAPYLLPDPSNDLKVLDQLVAQLDDVDLDLLKRVQARVSDIRYRVATDGVEIGVVVVEKEPPSDYRLVVNWTRFTEGDPIEEPVDYVRLRRLEAKGVVDIKDLLSARLLPQPGHQPPTWPVRMTPLGDRLLGILAQEPVASLLVDPGRPLRTQAAL